MPMKELAQAVIVSAVVDYLTGGGYCTTTKGIQKDMWRDDAKRFLFSDSGHTARPRRVWCEIAGLDEEYIQNGVRRAMKDGACANKLELKRMLKNIQAKRRGVDDEDNSGQVWQQRADS